MELAKKIAKHRDGYRCQWARCPRSSKGGFQMHGSHIFPEGRYHALSINPENIETLCARHHMEWHEHPIEGVKRLRKRSGALYEKLTKLSLIEVKMDYEKEHFFLKKELSDMLN